MCISTFLKKGLLCCWLVVTSIASSAQWRAIDQLEVYTQSALHVYVGKHGFLWIFTQQNELIRYDGKNKKVYSVNGLNRTGHFYIVDRDDREYIIEKADGNYHVFGNIYRGEFYKLQDGVIDSLPPQPVSTPKTVSHNGLTCFIEGANIFYKLNNQKKHIKSFQTDDSTKLFFLPKINASSPTLMFHDRTIYQLQKSGNSWKLTQVVADVPFENIRSIQLAKNIGKLVLIDKNLGIQIVDYQPFRTTYSPEFRAQSNYSVIVHNDTVFSHRTHLIVDGELKLLDSTYHLNGYAKIKYNDELYMVNDSGLYKKKGWSWKLIRPHYNWHPKSNMIVDEENHLWIGYLGKMTNPFEDSSYVLEERFKNYIKGLWTMNGGILIAGNRGLYFCKGEKIEPYLKTFEYAIRDLLILGEDTLLLATANNGLLVLAKGEITKLPVSQFKEINDAHRLLKDYQNTLWVTTNNGLFNIKMSQIYEFIRNKSDYIGAAYFDRSSGLVTNEFNGGANDCGTLVNSDLIILPTIKGLTYFNPNKVHRYTNQILHFTHKNDVVANKSQLNFDQDEEPIRFENRGLYFNHYNNAQIRYRLGKSSPWVYLEENENLVFRSLHHGSYKLSIQLITYEGVADELIVGLNVLPLWYQTNWAKLGMWLSGIGLVILFVRLRLAQLRKRAISLQEEVDRQKGDLQDQFDSLQDYAGRLEASQEQVVKQMVFREKIIGLISHDIMGSIRSLSIVGRNAVGNPEQQESSIAHMIDASDNIELSLQNTLDWAKTQRNDLRLQPQKIRIKKLLDDVLHLLRFNSKMKNGSFTNEVDPTLSIESDEHMLRSILQNLLENELKHSQASNISLLADEEDHFIELKIINAASPFEGMEEVNQYFKSRSDESRMVRMTGGLGTILIKELLDKLGGELHIEKYEEMGHSINLSLPKELSA